MLGQRLKFQQNPTVYLNYRIHNVLKSVKKVQNKHLSIHSQYVERKIRSFIVYRKVHHFLYSLFSITSSNPIIKYAFHIFKILKQ